MSFSPAHLMATRGLALANFLTLGVLFASAGLYVQEFRGLDVHGVAAIGLHITSGALALTLILRAWVTRTGLVAAVTAVLLFGLTFLQALLGSSMTLAFHLSGALILTAMATWLIVWAFSRQRRSDPRRPRTLRSHSPEGAIS